MKITRKLTTMMMLLVATIVPVGQLAGAECPPTATSRSGMLEGVLISGTCFNVLGCGVCSCSYMGKHIVTGMRMSFNLSTTGCT